MTPARVARTEPIDIWSEIGPIRRRIAEATRLFLFLDFDGTLAPIAPAPSLAIMPPPLKNLLDSLCERRDIVAAVISGRTVEDLAPRVGLSAVYAGNHGLEIRGMGLDYGESVHPQAALQLLDCCKVLRVHLEPFPGAWIEDKGRTAAVHVRQVARYHVPVVEEVVRTTIMDYPGLRIGSGKEVFEIRPNIAWNKGCAARWILHRMEGRETDAICLGDDSTDEDMFRELASGITIRIGAGSHSSAQYWLADTEVLRFFSFLQKAVEDLRGCSHARV